jgi:hypothetical protein
MVIIKSNQITGVLLFCKGDVSRASDCFDNALKANPKNAPALLGKVPKIYSKILTFNRHAFTLTKVKSKKP